MRGTRRFWEIVSIGLFLALLSVLLSSLVLLVSTALIGVYLLSSQYIFYRDLKNLKENLEVSQSTQRSLVSIDEKYTHKLDINLKTSTSLDVEVSVDPPMVVDGSKQKIKLNKQGQDSYISTYSIGMAGTYTYKSPKVKARDKFGFLEEELGFGEEIQVAVQPNTPRNIHIGQGGEQQIAAQYGEHKQGKIGSGMEPAELRKYQRGDPTGKIDWKATARLNQAYIREFEAETDKRTILYIDHRKKMDTGPIGQTKLDYIRQVSLAFIETARNLNDPLGLYTIGDQGPTTKLNPNTTKQQYTQITNKIHNLKPTKTKQKQTLYSPQKAKNKAFNLRKDKTKLKKLEKYFQQQQTYIQKIQKDPFFNTAQLYLTNLQGTTWTAIFTDDTEKQTLKETAKIARKKDNHCLIFITPEILFKKGTLKDLDKAYQKYKEFEQYRKKLTKLPRITAYEIAPGDKLTTILTQNKQKTTTKT